MIDLLVAGILSCSESQKLVQRAANQDLPISVKAEVIETLKSNAPANCDFGQNDEST